MLEAGALVWLAYKQEAAVSGARAADAQLRLEHAAASAARAAALSATAQAAVAATPAPPASGTAAEAAQGAVSGAGPRSSSPRLPAPEAAAAPPWRPGADAPLGGRVKRAREESPEWAAPRKCTLSFIELIALLQTKLLTYITQ
ncbi:uncharacterized protein N7506_006948 [Penicillium brevicompactum]|uniref:uncharacterized protein n=1 Tax=Penicillium brevicompactum TaxID=5074 RepID=UPI00253FC561|nr:uncharacterized protein N7506_006948 [Penicillium brevicompactum]KAJ5333165.1 hypothetical protein N7506_006948 [Penicillium brevicompactum]